MKQLYKITITYSNTKITKSYIKDFSHLKFVKQFCKFKETSSKIVSCKYELVKELVKEPAKEDVLVAIKNKPNYYRDAKGYKYYIKDGIKIKSKQPVYD